jgi:hypothetical protein
MIKSLLLLVFSSVAFSQSAPAWNEVTSSYGTALFVAYSRPVWDPVAQCTWMPIKNNGNISIYTSDYYCLASSPTAPYGTLTLAVAMSSGATGNDPAICTAFPDTPTKVGVGHPMGQLLVDT